MRKAIRMPMVGDGPYYCGVAFPSFTSRTRQDFPPYESLRASSLSPKIVIKPCSAGHKYHQTSKSFHNPTVEGTYLKISSSKLGDEAEVYFYFLHYKCREALANGRGAPSNQPQQQSPPAERPRCQTLFG